MYRPIMEDTMSLQRIEDKLAVYGKEVIALEQAIQERNKRLDHFGALRDNGYPTDRIMAYIHTEKEAINQCETLLREVKKEQHLAREQWKECKKKATEMNIERINYRLKGHERAVVNKSILPMLREFYSETPRQGYRNCINTLVMMLNGDHKFGSCVDIENEEEK